MYFATGMSLHTAGGDLIQGLVRSGWSATSASVYHRTPLRDTLLTWSGLNGIAMAAIDMHSDPGKSP